MNTPSTKRLEVLIAAALIEYFKGLPHERALDDAQSQELPPIVRKTALFLLAWYAGKQTQDEPLVLVMVPGERSNRRRELSPVRS
jgi:Ser/Thr protein kinase RdoA (MazF antagonist)